MACPICGAKCKCKKRGQGGICCSCHRHKVNGKRLERGSPELKAWRDKHGYDNTEQKQQPAAASPSLW